MVQALERLDRFQQRTPPVSLPIAVATRFGEHDGSRLAATVSYYSFFSVFPLLLVLVTVLGIVLRDDPELRAELVDGALGRIPVVGTELGADAGSLPGSGWVLAFGVATALWAGMAAVGALQAALDVISDTPVHARPNLVVKRLRSLGFLVLLGLGLASSTVLANLATLFDLGGFGGAAGVAATLLVNVLLVAMTFSVLPARRRPVRQLLPGAILGGAALVALQLLGSYIVRRFIDGASDTYGTFAVVIALLSWFHLVSRVVLLAAELNEVLAERLNPRRLVAAGPTTDADRRATMLDVQRIQRDTRLGYAVAVDGHVATDAEPLGLDGGPEHEPVHGGPRRAVRS